MQPMGIGAVAANLTGQLNAFTDTTLNMGPLFGLMIAFMGLMSMRAQALNGTIHTGFFIHGLMSLGGFAGFTGIVTPEMLSDIHASTFGMAHGGGMDLMDLASAVGNLGSMVSHAPAALMSHLPSAAASVACK